MSLLMASETATVGSQFPTAVYKGSFYLAKAGRTLFKIGMFADYFWFGALKVAGISPADDLCRTLYRAIIPLQIFPADWVCRYIVGLSEVAASFIFLLTLAPFRTIRLYSLVLSMIIGSLHVLSVSIVPMILIPDEVWQQTRFPYGLTLEGQYIVKNIVLLAAFLMLGDELAHQEYRTFGSLPRDFV
mmetsp:Transcript_68088/g.127147  ORF Transcript_68088/g.127147 Transcript_68088/m.127147 type:complete len:187 (-) Transcript_68088:33-593(-)